MRTPAGHQLGATSTLGHWRCECGLDIYAQASDDLDVRRKHRQHLDAVLAVGRASHPAFGGRA